MENILVFICTWTNKQSVFQILVPNQVKIWINSIMKMISYFQSNVSIICQRHTNIYKVLTHFLFAENDILLSCQILQKQIWIVHLHIYCNIPWIMSKCIINYIIIIKYIPVEAISIGTLLGHTLIGIEMAYHYKWHHESLSAI